MAEAKKKTTSRAKTKEKEDASGGLKMFKTYDSAQEALSAIKDYFFDCDTHDIYYGEAGMAQAIKVSLATLRGWFDGKAGPEFQEVAQWAYQEIAIMFESNPDFCRDKVLSKHGWSMMKQPRFQAYQDKTEEKVEAKIQVQFGKGMDKDCFD